MRKGARLSALLVSVVMLWATAAGAYADPAHAGRHAASGVYGRQVAKLPAKFTRQKLSWTPCNAKIKDARVKRFWQGAQCALLTAPLDYARPGGKTIRIAVDRVAAASRGLGVLMTNPGGPGGAGLSLAAALANGADSPDVLHARFDLVGMNPRGVGPSTDSSGKNETLVMGLGATSLRCATGTITFRPPALPAWASAALRAQAGNAAGQEAACQQAANGIRPYITTMNTARDIDLLRIVLGKKKINYYGVSYGTFLGAVYGAMFPRNLNRMVVDGSMSPVTSWYDEGKFDNEAKLHNFDAFAKWAVATRQGLGGTPRAVRATVDKLYADVSRSPQPIAGYTADGLAKDIGEFTRFRPEWEKFAASLRNAVTADGGGQADKALTQDVTSASNLVPEPTDETPRAGADLSDGVYNAVTCDWSWPKPNDVGYKVYDNNIGYWQKTFRYAGTTSAAGPSACTYLSYRPVEKLPVIRARGGYPKGLVVSTDGDTQTPLSMATQMARTLRFDLITVTNDGTHGIAFSGNACVDKAVTRYLVDGKLPGSITCATTSPPGRGTSLTSGATEAATTENTPVGEEIQTATTR